MKKLPQWLLLNDRTEGVLVKSVLSMCMLLIMAACAGAGGNSMNKSLVAKVLLSSSNCGVMSKGASLSVVSSGDELDKVNPQLASFARKALGENFNTVFDSELVMQINMGMKPTGGYRLALAEDVSVSEDSWVNIGVKWNIPEKGAMLTQALTSPCMLVAIPKQKYVGIRILDQAGKIKLQTSM